ncbi:MAG TPA: lytic transglycosylase domain-containing protein [Desulfotomaculum sp.]|nr:lytic transglycosylase domain-containing protein [Desulfotomaculum sp.]
MRKKTVRALIVILAFVLLFANIKEIGRYYYPFKYREAVFRCALANGLDPFLTAAIIKVESDYRPGAVSPRGAVGLMQLMPKTARWIAEQQGESFDPASLSDPERNIAYGTWYLAFLGREFNDMVIALAAYNAGRGNVKRWLCEQRWTGKAEDLDQIPFPETRQFIRKTIWTYRIYRFLYGNVSASTTSAQRIQSPGETLPCPAASV